MAGKREEWRVMLHFENQHDNASREGQVQCPLNALYKQQGLCPIRSERFLGT